MCILFCLLQFGLDLFVLLQATSPFLCRGPHYAMVPSVHPVLAQVQNRTESCRKFKFGVNIPTGPCNWFPS